MPFPFLWIGALVAATFLGLIFILFGVLMKVLNRATTEVRGSILPGLVVGIRDWTDEHRPAVELTVSPGAIEGGPTLDTTAGAPGLHLEPVRRTR